MVPPGTRAISAGQAAPATTLADAALPLCAFFGAPVVAVVCEGAAPKKRKPNSVPVTKMRCVAAASATTTTTTKTVRPHRRGGGSRSARPRYDEAVAPVVRAWIRAGGAAAANRPEDDADDCFGGRLTG